jgi:peptidoglycan/LPS O-acetylase OafA/YrhL
VKDEIEQSSNVSPGGGRFILLDFSRGVAAFSILVFHHYQFRQFSSLYSSVDFFFVLSGFVLLPSIERVMNYEEARLFIRSRAVRLLPMSIATILFVLFVEVLIKTKHYIFNEPSREGIPIDLRSLIYALLLFQVFSQTAQWLNGPLWSLSVEWVSNIVFAVFSIARISKYILAILFGIILQVYSLFGGDPWGMQLGRGLFAFTIGAIARKYLYQNWRNTPVKTLLSLVIFLGFHILLIYWSHNLIVVAPVVFLFLILNTSKIEINSIGVIRLSEFLGKYSYGFYAWHFPLLSLTGISVGRISSHIALIEGWKVHIVFIVTIAVTLVMTFLVIHFIEPKARKHFLPHHTQ